MSEFPFTVAPEQADDAARIETLYAIAFGPGRFARTAYRLREGLAPVEGLSFVARFGGRLIGSVRFAPVTLAGRPGLLLGPLVVDPDWKGKGCGLALMRAGIAAARVAGHGWIVLVGDEPYYARAGFARVAPGRIALPGPVDPARLLALELVEGALDGLCGRLVGGA